MTMQIEPISAEDKKPILDVVRTFWGDETIIVHNEIFLVSELDGLKAVEEQNIIAVLHYRLLGEECEILTLASTKPGRGGGTALIAEVEKIARKNRCRLISLITTNDNLHTLGFYQRRGFHLAGLYPDQVTKSRLIKPSIPDIGKNVTRWKSGYDIINSMIRKRNCLSPGLDHPQKNTLSFSPSPGDVKHLGRWVQAEKLIALFLQFD